MRGENNAKLCKHQLGMNKREAHSFVLMCSNYNRMYAISRSLLKSVVFFCLIPLFFFLSAVFSRFPLSLFFFKVYSLNNKKNIFNGKKTTKLDVLNPQQCLNHTRRTLLRSGKKNKSKLFIYECRHPLI